MYLSVQDSDSKRAFILVDLHSLDGGIMQVQLKKGVMDMLVLALLTQNDRYGYEIVSKISEYIELSEGTIYPLFNRLKKEKYVEYLNRYAKSSSPSFLMRAYRLFPQNIVFISRVVGAIQWRFEKYIVKRFWRVLK